MHLSREAQDHGRGTRSTCCTQHRSPCSRVVSQANKLINKRCSVLPPRRIYLHNCLGCHVRVQNSWTGVLRFCLGVCLLWDKQAVTTSHVSVTARDIFRCLKGPFGAALQRAAPGPPLGSGRKHVGRVGPSFRGSSGKRMCRCGSGFGPLGHHVVGSPEGEHGHCLTPSPTALTVALKAHLTAAKGSRL